MANYSNKPYSSYLRTVGTASYVQGTSGNPELHCILGENAFCKPLTTKQTKNGPRETIDLAIFVKGQTDEIRKYFPMIAPMDDGTVAVHLTLWGEDAKKVDAEAVRAEQSGVKRNVRVAMVGYLYVDSYTGKNGQPQTSLKMMCQWLASCKARQPRQDQNGGQQYAGQYGAPPAPQYAGQYGAPSAPQYAGQVPQFNGAAPQYPAQGAPVAPQYPPQNAPAAPQYPPQNVPGAQQPMQPMQPTAPAQQTMPMQPMQPAAPAGQQPAAPTAGYAQNFAVIEEDDGELPF